jgi:hypothetical protein
MQPHAFESMLLDGIGGMVLIENDTSREEVHAGQETSISLQLLEVYGADVMNVWNLTCSLLADA